MNKEKNYKENIIILLKDMEIPQFIKGKHEPLFFCPKCKSSLIFLPEEYTKNNTINRANITNTNNIDPDIGEIFEVNDTWQRIILKCDQCQCADLLPKFLKEKKKIKYEDRLEMYNTGRAYF